MEKCQGLGKCVSRRSARPGAADAAATLFGVMRGHPLGGGWWIGFMGSNCCGFVEGRKASFLKKRSKKLFFLGFGPLDRVGLAGDSWRSRMV
jgi:hypothetical protein